VAADNAQTLAALLFLLAAATGSVLWPERGVRTAILRRVAAFLRVSVPAEARHMQVHMFIGVLGRLARVVELGL